MNIDSIQNGFVIDHIAPGKSMEIYLHLGLGALDCPVALIQNAKSSHMGRKDIIKIDAAIPLDLDLLGYIDPGATVNVIENGRVKEKKRLSPPERVEGVIFCKNPRCITTVEPGIRQVFLLIPGSKPPAYRCAYCEARGK